PALVNADHVDGFTLSGKGTINGNGLRYWKAFWLRRAWNPQCTNKDEMRPRLLYVSNSKNVQISGIKLINSPFWTSHYYKCENVKLLNLTFLSPEKPVKAPSTDAIDIDVCKNVLVKNCYMAVNDDAIALKGGKGPKADKDENNGGNYNIIIEDCTFGLSHSSLTCGSESIHDRNIIVRNCKLEGVRQLLHLKMRPDTPQNYEYILIENVTGTCGSFLSVRPWTQFFDIKGEEKMPVSYSSNITFRNIDVTCDTFFGVVDSEQYRLSDFTFENLNITAKNNTEINTKSIQNMIIRNVSVNGKKIK
ncbi:MAG: glycosyl hydrolase family 28 protein, partial [Petrimonas sp.]|nr:glycosyl hydrolase family 28 protein [Petrimonas sp.]